MALGILLVFFVTLFIIAVTCVILLFVAKKRKTNRIIIWSSAIFGMFIGFISATSLPSNDWFEQCMAWGFGGISCIGLFYHYKRKDLIAKILISISIILGIIQLFFFH